MHPHAAVSHQPICKVHSKYQPWLFLFIQKTDSPQILAVPKRRCVMYLIFIPLRCMVHRILLHGTPTHSIREKFRKALYDYPQVNSQATYNEEKKHRKIVQTKHTKFNEQRENEKKIVPRFQLITLAECVPHIGTRIIISFAAWRMCVYVCQLFSP